MCAKNGGVTKRIALTKRKTVLFWVVWCRTVGSLACFEQLGRDIHEQDMDSQLAYVCSRVSSYRRYECLRVDISSWHIDSGPPESRSHQHSVHSARPSNYVGWAAVARWFSDTLSVTPELSQKHVSRNI